MPSTRTCYFSCLILLLWLSVWIFLSWGAVQDDALIHLRYADNLASLSFVTYDGTHPNYGTSSLLYVGLLSLLRRMTASPDLPRMVSSAVHLVLFCGLAMAFTSCLRRRAREARIAAMVLLAMLATPSAVRWLDDGMETGLVFSVVTLMAWLIHREVGSSRLRMGLLGVVAFLAVMLRTELLLVCGVALAILLIEFWSHRAPSLEKSCVVNAKSSPLQETNRDIDDARPDIHGSVLHDTRRDIRARGILRIKRAILSGAQRSRRTCFSSPDLSKNGTSNDTRKGTQTVPAASTGPIISTALGAGIAVAVILATTHVLLPDTAVAKSHGIAHWFSPIHDTAVTLAGAFSFGAGMLIFWLLTLAMVAMRIGLTLRTVLPNCLCPTVLAMSSLRGQEIQGVRYFSWTFAFSIVWNILELAREPEPARTVRLSDRRSAGLLYVFAALLAIELPVESVAMHRVLTRRSETMRLFASQHLEVLRSRRGVASDIGFIGYFTGAQICDLAGLVNGRAAARLSSRERVNACARAKPEFMFLNSSQFGSMAAVMEMNDWKVCGRYDFPNIRTSDRHYLLVRPEIAHEVCQATRSQPETIAAAFSPAPALVAQRAGE